MISSISDYRAFFIIFTADSYKRIIPLLKIILVNTKCMKKNLFRNSKLFLLGLMFIALSEIANAQIPQFYNYNAGGSANVFPMGSATNKVQWVYPPLVFNSMGTLGGTPAYAGLITKVYFRIGTANPFNYPDFTISLGQNVGTISGFPNGIYNTGLTQVFYQNPYSYTGINTASWYGVTLQTPIPYDPSLSLVFEMKHSGIGPSNTVLQNSAVANTRIWGTYLATTGSFGSGLIDFGFDLIPQTPCTGTPVAGSINPNNPTVCTGQSLLLTVTGATLAANMFYQWQQSINGGVTWTNIAGANNFSYTTPGLVSNIMYRFIDSCINSGLSDTSNPITVTVAPPTYATLPYYQDFENWASYCSNKDIPDDYRWTNNPATGNDSWRRYDEGGTAAWTNSTLGAYFPASTTGIYSARYHSYSGSGIGNLNLYVNCSGVIGNKTLVFDYINNNSAGGNDFLQVEMSTNGGTFFIPIASFGSSPGWSTNYVSIPSNTANTIVRLSASGGSNNVAASDIGVDNLFVLNPCSGQPSAGIIDSITPCANQNFTMHLSGSSLSGGLNFTWESAPSATGPWSLVSVTPGPQVTTNINTPTYFRCIVDCPTSGLSDTTPVRYVQLGSFWVCYCGSQSIQILTDNIGNVKISPLGSASPILDNGNPSPLVVNPTSVNSYTNFTALPPITLYRDSTYNLSITGITYNSTYAASYCATYIDFNRDGIYDPVNERIMGFSLLSPTNFNTGNFIVPPNAQYGLTGMRVVNMQGGSATTISPCGSYNFGETEDYVANIAPAPCNKPPYAGNAYQTDTATCPSTPVVIWDTNYDKLYAGLTWNWQVSTDGINYSDIAGATQDTIIVTPTVNSWYRLRVTCDLISNGYSNVLHVSMLPALNCFGVSGSSGTINDSSDIGAVVFSTPQPTNVNLYTFSSGGPHLNNPNATRFYTNYTPTGIVDLYADSTYKISVYEIMRSATHADARVTIFIDLNDNFVFDLPFERIYSGLADINNYFLNTQVYIPANVVLNKALPMRVVLNNDVGPNAASNTGYGTFTSGETEDFFVRFSEKPSSTIGVNDISSIEQVGIYPNPTNGLLNIEFNSTTKQDIQIEVVSVTGALILQQTYKNVHDKFNKSIDLSGLAKGFYLLKINAQDANFIRKITLE